MSAALAMRSGARVPWFLAFMAAAISALLRSSFMVQFLFHCAAARLLHAPTATHEGTKARRHEGDLSDRMESCTCLS
jgi:hypothetical protein